jgi:putative glutamine amidotransferase
VKPVIGITTRRFQTETRHLDVVEQAYADAVSGAGGLPRLLPCRGEPSELNEIQGIDGLLVQLAIRTSVPVLGICRGNQILNVAFGGSLIQHLPARTTQPHLVTEREQIVHRVRIEPDTRLFGVELSADIGVNSIHHQAVDAIGPDLRASAWSEDGIIEAVEHPRLPILGVQWHPENLLFEPAHVALFAWLVYQAACAGREGGARGSDG